MRFNRRGPPADWHQLVKIYWSVLLQKKKQRNARRGKCYVANKRNSSKYVFASPKCRHLEFRELGKLGEDRENYKCSLTILPPGVFGNTQY